MENIKVYKFYIKSKKYHSGVTLRQPAQSQEQAEIEVKRDFEDINDNITYFKFIGIED